MTKNYYKVLGVSPDASVDEIRSAYRRLALERHPDRHSGDATAEEKMKELNFVYSVLSDARSRSAYDATYTPEAENGHSSEVVFLWTPERNVVDASGMQRVLRQGDFIYYPVGDDTKAGSARCKKADYYPLYVRRVIRCSPSEQGEAAESASPRGEPICVVEFQGADVVIYADDLREFWLTEASYKAQEMRRGARTGAVILVLLSLVTWYLFSSFRLTPEQRLRLTQTAAVTEPVNQISKEERNRLEKDYQATTGEINYVLTNKYTLCDRETGSLKEDVEVRSVPDPYGVVVAELKAGTKVKVLMYCEDRDAYKISSSDTNGWIQGKTLLYGGAQHKDE